MNSAPNWAQIVSAIGGLAGFTALVIELVARWHRKKRPPDELLAGLIWLQDAFGDILASGGRRTQWFLEPERRQRGTNLAILNGQIVDDKLNDGVGIARSCYEDSFALSSGHGDASRRLLQEEAAEAGRSACVDAINRANELIRKYRA